MRKQLELEDNMADPTVSKDQKRKTKKHKKANHNRSVVFFWTLNVHFVCGVSNTRKWPRGEADEPSTDPHTHLFTLSLSLSFLVWFVCCLKMCLNRRF